MTKELLFCSLSFETAIEQQLQHCSSEEWMSHFLFKPYWSATFINWYLFVFVFMNQLSPLSFDWQCDFKYYCKIKGKRIFLKQSMLLSYTLNVVLCCWICSFVFQARIQRGSQLGYIGFCWKAYIFRTSNINSWRCHRIIHLSLLPI